MNLPAIPAAASGPWPAPAKLNLMLHVVGRREDGYHELQTLFQFLTISDWLYFEPRSDGQVELRGGVEGLAAGDDLCVRAARLLKAACGIDAGVTIYNDKRLPVGGGLGGGSSDAATTLRVLNRLWSAGLDAPALARLGLELGADVPVFVHGQAAWAEGVGEILTPVEPPQTWFLVVNPAVSVSTSAIFSDPRLTRDTPRTKIPDPVSSPGKNDCEPVVREHYPEIGRAIDWLGRYGPARMTGTGACVFVPFATEEEARAAASELPGNWSGMVARGVNRSPLLTALD